MSSAAEAAGIGFGFLDSRLREAVAAAAAHDPNPADPFRGTYISDGQAVALAEAIIDPGDADARLAGLAARLGLDALDTAVLGLCAAPELDDRYGRLFAYLHDDIARKHASPRLAARLLSGPGVGAGDVLACFATAAPLRHSGALRLLGHEANTPLADRQARVAGRLAGSLLGAHIDDGGLALRRIDVPDDDPGRPETVTRIQTLLAAREAADPPPLLVAGPDAGLLVATAAARGLLVAPLRVLTDPDSAADAALAAGLEGRVPCFDGLEDLEPGDRPAIGRALDGFDGPLVILARTRSDALVLGDRALLLVEARLPSFAERARAWQACGGTDDVTEAAAKFRLSIGQVAEASRVAAIEAHARGAVAPTAADLDLGARRASSSRLGELAARLEPTMGFDDLVLPDRQRDLLRSVSSWLRHRDLVLSDWGYERTVARDQGLKVLFAGESGTGKTMAAEVLAGELGLELFRVDLATIVSKWIGETEKNLDRVFAAADGSNAILFFDEADALFGKRSDVSDAHDRYANLEVAYLLQKMEGYAGAAILATNFRRNIDDAFVRRLDFVIDFPFPEAEDRLRLWRLLVPVEAPLDADVELEFLATRFKLSGGAIRNCSLSAAFQAAEEDVPAIAMRHLVRAVAHEFGKQGRLTLQADFEHYHELVRPG